MIVLQRERSAQAINAKYRGAKKAAKDLELLQVQWAMLQGSGTPHVFLPAFWKTAKEQLKKESGGKCAYCEANTAIVAHGDVEHYRPKSIYWWLAYTYDNYLYACQICNQTYKSDNFPCSSQAQLTAPAITAHTTSVELQRLVGFLSPDPLRPADGYSLARYEQEHQREQVLLLNPYFDDPQHYFAYEADDVTQEVTLVPASPASQKHVRAAEEFYGLNRIELKNLRYKIYKTFSLLRRSLASVSDEALQTDIREHLLAMQADSYVFAGMNRFFATRP